MPSKSSRSTRWKLFPAALAALFLLTSCGNRVSPASKPQLPPPFEFLGSWGMKGQGPGQLDAPVSLAADALGNVLFADPAATFIHKFEANGTPLLSFQEPRVRRAAGIAVDSGGAIYVASAQQGAIFLFVPDGTFLESWRGPAARHFSGPLGFSIDDQGDLYAPDPSKSRIVKLSNHGHLLKTWPAPQKAATPDEKPSWVCAEPDKFVYVAYFATGRVEKFLSDGSWVNTWQTAIAQSADSAAISGFAVAGDFVFTIAPASSTLRVWTSDGQHKLDADLVASTGKIAAPQLAVTPRSELLVFDPAAPKVYRFRMHLAGQEPL